MASAATGLKRWENFSTQPTILASSQNSHWQGGEFQEACIPESGFFDPRCEGFAQDLILSWMREPTSVRWSGRKTFCTVECHPILYTRSDARYGEWKGAARTFSLFISQRLVESTLWARTIGASRNRMEELAPGIQHLLDILHLDVTADSPAGPALGEAAIVQILHLLFPDDGRQDDVESRSGSPAIRRACDMIEAALASRISLVALARSLDISARHLTRVFRSTTGYSPHEYITLRRLARARELIERGGLSLAEVAENVGFVSHAHMTATFRKILGVPPSYFSNRGIEIPISKIGMSRI